MGQHCSVQHTNYKEFRDHQSEKKITGPCIFLLLLVLGFVRVPLHFDPFLLLESLPLLQYRPFLGFAPLHSTWKACSDHSPRKQRVRPKLPIITSLSQHNESKTYSIHECE